MYYEEKNPNPVIAKIVKVVLTETKQYKPMYVRPYEANVTYNDLNYISDTLGRAIESGANKEIAINNMLTTNMPGIIMPSANVISEAPIINGWDNVRFKFDIIMDIYITGSNIVNVFYIQGYSDYYGRSNGGHIDDNMAMFVNSIITLRKTTNPNTGVVNTVVLDNNNMAFDETGILAKQHYENKLKVTRPDDIMSKISTLKETNANTRIVSNIGNLSDLQVVDNETATPMGHLASTLNSAIDMTMQNGAYGSDGDIYDAITGDSISKMPNNIDFYKILRGVKGNDIESFTLRDLMSIDPSMRPPDVFVTKDSVTARTSLIDPLASENMNTTSYESRTSLVVQETLNMVLAESVLSTISFTVENSSGKTNYKADAYTSLIPNIDQYTLFLEANKLINTFISKCWNIISSNNKMLYLLNITVLKTEMLITTNVENNGEIAFVYPTFADAKFMPIIMNERYQDSLAETYGNVMDTAITTVRGIQEKNSRFTL